MTSSVQLKNRKMRPEVWHFGPWANHYIVPGGTKECHPDYRAIPIGDPYGFLVCVRKTPQSGVPHQSTVKNGIHRYSLTLYEPNKQPRQMNEPLTPAQRRAPHDAYNISHDYQRLPMKYNATGIEKIRMPHPEQQPYKEYGYSYTNIPPPKYDITRLEQPYPVFRNEKKYIGYSTQTLDEFDKNWTVRRV